MGNTIWILGSLASGKTTLNKALLEKWGDKNPKLISSEEKGIPYIYTYHNEVISSLGNMNDSQCCGLDRVSSKLKNVGIELSLQKALQDSNFVIVESIMSASTWFPFIDKHSDKIFLIHIYCSFEENVERLKTRKIMKNPNKRFCMPKDLLDTRLTDDNYEFIRKTRMQYRGIYDKFKERCNSIDINTEEESEIGVANKVLKFIVSNA